MLTVKGKHAVLEALEARQPIRYIVVSSQITSRPDFKRLQSLSQQQGISVDVLRETDFQRRFPDSNSQGMVAVLKDVSFYPLDRVLKGDVSQRKIVVLDHLQDPHNVGAILRTCECFGVDAVILPKDRQCPITGAVAKVSSGAVYHVPLIQVTNLGQALRQLREAGYWIYGTDVETGDSLYDTPLHQPMVLIVGQEGKGQSKGLRKWVHSHVHIPFEGQIESLNVSVATGVILSHVQFSQNKLNGGEG